MLYYFQRNKLSRHLLVGGALCAAGLGMFSCSDELNLDKDQPTGPGGVALNSLYGYVENAGNCNYYKRLIDDLGQGDYLSMAGSVTLFVADDAAFERFFQNNKWGVRSYDQLSQAQKGLLLKSSMIGNPLTSSMLSNATADGDAEPERGKVCRRLSQVDVLDSVAVVTGESTLLPNNTFLKDFKVSHAGKPTVVFFDATKSQPMVHFTSKYMSTNRLTYSDIDFLMNDKSMSLTNSPHEFLIINNTHVNSMADDANIYCKNGFIHKVNDVVMPLDNMAEIIRQDAQSSTYSSILERFSSLSYDKAGTDGICDRYNKTFGTRYDSVYVKRYFSKRTAGTSKTTALAFDEQLELNKQSCEGLLKYDPAWNTYHPNQAALGNDPMMKDMGVMLVPTNAAMSDWWNNGGGKVIKDFYNTLDDTPLQVLAALVDVNMMESLISTVPSRFHKVLDDASEPLGIKMEDVDRVTIGANGIVYHTNKVFAPASYSSVVFPALIDTTQFKILWQAIEILDYKTYLNSMATTYSFFLPTNNGLMSFVDPVSMATTQPHIWEFQYSTNDKVWAEVYEANLVGDQWVKGATTKRHVGDDGKGNALGIYSRRNNSKGNSYLKDRFEEILDNCIAIEPLQDGKKFYRTKGNTFIKVEGDKSNIASMKVYGGQQAATGQNVSVTQSYNMKNGNTYVVDGVVAGSHLNVVSTLEKYPEFSEFLWAIRKANALAYTNPNDNWRAAVLERSDGSNGNMLVSRRQGAVGGEVPTQPNKDKTKVTYLFNNYHYTLYAPTNDAMKLAYAAGLPDEAAFQLLEDERDSYDEDYLKDSVQNIIDGMSEVLLDFIKFHIHDTALFLDKGFNTGSYETMKVKLDAYPEGEDLDKLKDKYKDTMIDTVSFYAPRRPYTLQVTDVSPTALTIKDSYGSHSVVPSLANIMATEYWIKGTGQVTDPTSREIVNSSFVAIHGISTPLFFDKEKQFKYVPKYVVAGD